MSGRWRSSVWASPGTTCTMPIRLVPGMGYGAARSTCPHGSSGCSRSSAGCTTCAGRGRTAWPVSPPHRTGSGAGGLDEAAVRELPDQSGLDAVFPLLPIPLLQPEAEPLGDGEGQERSGDDGDAEEDGEGGQRQVEVGGDLVVGGGRPQETVEG